MSEAYQIRIRVYVGDTDAFGVLHHANYLHYFERARTEYLRHQGIDIATLSKQGYSLVVTELSTEYLKPSWLDDEIVVSARLEKCRMSLAIFSQDIRTLSGDLKAKAMVKIVSIDSSGELCRIEPLLKVKE